MPSQLLRGGGEVGEMTPHSIRPSCLCSAVGTPEEEQVRLSVARSEAHTGHLGVGGGGGRY